MNETMKKALALLTVAMLLVGTSGCGCCRGLFGKSSKPLATPVYSQCAPSCAPTCSTGAICNTGSACGCSTGNPVMYGYNGGIPMAPSAAYGSTPMTFPTGSGTFGQ